MNKRHVYDVLIVGSGATGGWAAKELTEGGLDVLVLEAGRKIQPKQFMSQPRELGPGVFAERRTHPYSFPEDKPFRWNRHRVHGGRTLLWNRVSLRFSDHDFHAADYDGYGENWPISYAELAPFYDRVETFWGISGARDGIPHLPDGMFLPPREMTNGERRIKQAVGRLWKDRDVINQRGVLSNETTPERWGFQTSVGSSLADAEKTGRLTTRADTVVSHLVMHPTKSRVKGVVCVDTSTGETFEEHARIIMLCASSYESVRILLNSIAKEEHSQIEDASEVLGHYLLDHTTIKFSGVMNQLKGQPLNSNSGGPYGIYIPRFRNLAEPHPDYLRGFGVMGHAQRRERQYIQVEDTSTAYDVPSSEGVRLSLIGYGEMLSVYENRLSLDKNLTDNWGIPAVHIDMKYGDNEAAMTQDMVNFFGELLRELEVDIPGNEIYLLTPGSSIHECGGARMGTDPKSSVLNCHNQLWNVPNLFLTDGSCFVTNPCQNPTLTMVAMTSRACSFILEQLRTGDM